MTSQIVFLSSLALGAEHWPGHTAAFSRLAALDAQGTLAVGPNILPFATDEEHIPPQLHGSCNGLICRPMWKGRVTERLITTIRDNTAPTFYIATLSAGIDHIDDAVLTMDGIEVIRATVGNANETAEATIVLAISLLRQILPSVINMSFGIYSRRALPTARTLTNKTWTIFGTGQVGTEVIKRLPGLGVRKIVAYYDGDMEDKLRRLRSSLAESTHFRLENIRVVDSLAPGDPVTTGHDDISLTLTSDKVGALNVADVVSLHVPGNAVDLIDGAALSALRPSAILINMARHNVIAQNALLEALREGRLAGYATDVLPYDFETDNYCALSSDHPAMATWRQACWATLSRILRPVDHAVLNFSGLRYGKLFLPDAADRRGTTNFALTPHLGGSTIEAEEAIAQQVFDTLLDKLLPEAV